MIRSVLMALIEIVSVSTFIYAMSITHHGRPENKKTSSLIPPYSRGGSISGRIVDSQGHPIVRERVFAVSEQYGDAKRPGSYSVRTISALTGAQGNYRIPEVAPGNYIVSIGPSPEGEANSQPGKKTYYVKRYYPSTYSKENAKVIEVSEGAEINDINITAGEMKTTVEIRGRAINADTGQPIAGVAMSYGVAHQGGAGAMGAFSMSGSMGEMQSGIRSNEKGEFIITGVVPGKYYVTLDGQRNQDAEYYAEPTDAGVADNGISDLIVKLRRGITISGRVEVQGTNDLEMLSKVKELRITATSRPIQFQPFPPDGNRYATISSDETFVLKGIRPGKVSLSLNSSSQGGGVFQLERIEYKGVGIDREGIEVGAGEKLTDVRLIVEYGAITVHGKVTINGKLPEGLKLRLVVSRQGDAPPVFKDTDVDEQGRFVVTNLSAGVYTFRLRPLPSRTLGENYKVIFEAVRRAEQKVVVSENNQQPIALTLDLNP